jgi:uncharacterized protein (DUF3820 family)
MDDLAARMRADLEEIGRTFMPFGKYGPQHFPPNGVPIYDIPAEYLGWFANKAGFPKGRLGELAADGASDEGGWVRRCVRCVSEEVWEHGPQAGEAEVMEV